MREGSVTSLRAEIICNPAAGTGRIIRAEQTFTALQNRGWQAEVQFTEGPRHATELARNAVDKKVSVVFAVGGDGTLNEIAHGLAGTDTSLGVVPAGTINILATELKIPSDPTKAIESVLQQDNALRTKRIDVGELNDNSFVCVAGAGFTAETLYEVQKPGQSRKRGGRHVYAWEAVRRGAFAAAVDARVLVEDEEVYRGKLFDMTVNNTQRAADWKVQSGHCDDGLLDASIFRGSVRGINGSLFAMGVAHSILLPGTEIPRYKSVQQGSSFTLETRKQISAHRDGETLEKDTFFHFGILPDALKIAVPDNKAITVFSR